MKYIIALCISIILLTRCTSYQYVASPNYVPLNEKKGELKANIALNSYQIGYSIFNNVSVFSTGYMRHRSTFRFVGKENSGDIFRKENSYTIDLGISYFNKLKNGIIYEVLIGSGIGSTEYRKTKDILQDYEFSMNSNKYNVFLQPNIGYKINSYFEIGAFSRFNYYNYFNLKTSLIIGSNYYLEYEDVFFNGKTKADLFLIEPGISLKGGFPEVKAHLSFSPVINMTDKSMRYRRLNLRLNIFLNIDFFKKKKEASLSGNNQL